MSLYAALERRYKSPEWALFREVGNATGAKCNRHADAVAMNLWPSRGMEIVGIEVKSYRADFLQELKNPAKAEPVMQFCDRWYLVAADDKIVMPGELPPTWGLLVLQGGRLVQKVEAPKLTPKPVTREFFGALVRRAHENPPGAEEIRAAKEEGRQAGYQSGLETRKVNLGVDTETLKRLRKNVEAFELASGIKITEYGNGAELGQICKLMERITSGPGWRSVMNSMRAEAMQAKQHAELIIEVADNLDGILHPKATDGKAS